MNEDNLKLKNAILSCTGTENSLAEVYSLLEGPKLVHTFLDSKDKWFYHDGLSWIETTNEALQRQMSTKMHKVYTNTAQTLLMGAIGDENTMLVVDHLKKTADKLSANKRFQQSVVKELREYVNDNEFYTRLFSALPVDYRTR